VLQGANVFKNRLAKAMKDPDQRHHIHTSWRDDDEANETYSDFGPELEQLFDRTSTVFELARFDVARSTCEQLFEALSLQDDYGLGVHRPEGLDVREERGRFLRSVIEVTPEKQRARSLLETVRRLRQNLWDPSDTRTYAFGCANKQAWAFWVITTAAGCMILRSAVIAKNCSLHSCVEPTFRSS
jgi:hypothetical protein